MADNVAITPGSGATIAADDIGGALAQRVKVLIGADGSGTDLSSANPMPVTDAGGSLTVDGSVSLAAGSNNIGDVDVLSLPALPAGSNEIGGVNLARLNGTTVDVDSGNKSPGTQRIILATDQPALTNALLVSPVPRGAGGLLVSRLVSAAALNETVAKASPGQLYGWHLFNATSATRHLKVYNLAARPTVGTSTIFLTIPIPAGSAANVEFTCGIQMGTGIAYALTAGLADSDTAAVGANEVVVNLFYK